MNGNNSVNELPEDSAPLSVGRFLNPLEVAQLAIDSANAGIWIMNSDTNEFIPSNRTKALFGYDADDKMSFLDAMQQVTEKYRKSAVAAMESAMKDRKNLYIEYPVIGQRDQKDRWISLTGGFSDQHMKSGYFSGIVMDITEQKQNDLRRSKFIGMVSHELKTPLTALKAYVQMLSSWAQKQKDSFSIGALSKVDKQVKKMLNMINSLLNLSGAEAGKIQINKQPFGLSELISEVIEETLFVTTSHHIIFVPVENVTVVADRDKIEQVLVNLLSNAAKYSEQHTTIKVAITPQQTTVEISVTDQGHGIPADQIDKLFLAHYRVESKNTEKTTGFGIGLYLSSEIIKRHNSKIRVESEPGQGSTFKFSLSLQ